MGMGSDIRESGGAFMTFTTGLFIGLIVGTVAGMVLFSMFKVGKEQDLQDALIDILCILGYVPACKHVMMAIGRAQQALNRAYGGEVNE